MTKQDYGVEVSKVSFVTTSETPHSREEESFTDSLVTVISETLKQVFKEEGAAVIRGFLENASESRFRDIAENPEVFSASLKRMLGSGAPVVETLVLRNFCSRLGLAFEEKEDHSFPDYLKELKANWRR
ncbi:MAG: hypothetical protein NWE81_03075 [Candidatus Bathyarchaeota archaeon]|nr:hypothetical protein [Candidatus Bathyarchaeota archaeon]